VTAYEASLPDDGGVAESIAQPGDIERFAATFFKWNGGSNFTDNPVVKVQRQVNGEWVPFADQSGEIPVTVRFPQGEEVQSYLQGDQHWEWTAHFEAFASHFDTGMSALATPEGTYRFVVDGQRRQGGSAQPYHLESQSFLVKPWTGVTASDLRVDPGGRLGFAVGPTRTITVTSGGPTVDAKIGPIDYPDSYSSPAAFIRNQRTAYRDPAAPGDPTRIEWFCFTCSFRPWADTGDVETAYVTIEKRNTAVARLAARPRSDGRWFVTYKLKPGERAYVAAGDLTDEFGDYNGSASNTLHGKN
jgi:hypothetical protein